MVDPRAVRNPFTKKSTHLKRNTRGSKWVAVEGGHTTVQLASPGKTAAFQTHQFRNPSHSAPTYDVHHTGELSPPPMLTAAIYDPSDLHYLPNTHTRRPTVRSWGSLRPSVREEPEEDVSPRTSMPSQRSRRESPVSPLNGEPVVWRDSAVSVTDSKGRASDEKERQESNATVFPNFPYTINKTEDKPKKSKPTQTSRKPDGVYSSAKAIYAAGPKGEGQKLWKSYKIMRKVNQSRTAISEIPRQPLSKIDIPQGRRPSDALGLSAHPTTPTQPPVRPPPSQARIPPRIAVPVNEHLFPRKHSDISNTSYEVPVRVDSSTEQYASRSKPLPLFPNLQLAPKSRKQNPLDTHHLAPSQTSSKPLPPVPHPLPPVPHPLLPSNPHPNHSTPSRSKDPKLTHWWRTLADKTWESYIPPSKDVKISRPRPITALANGRTVNIAPSRGGVGGPGAYGHMSDQAWGKQKQIFPWMEKKRHDSEASFGCVGVEGLAERDGIRPAVVFRDEGWGD